MIFSASEQHLGSLLLWSNYAQEPLRLYTSTPLLTANGLAAHLRLWGLPARALSLRWPTLRFTIQTVASPVRAAEVVIEHFESKTIMTMSGNMGLDKHTIRLAGPAPRLVLNYVHLLPSSAIHHSRSLTNSSLSAALIKSTKAGCESGIKSCCSSLQSPLSLLHATVTLGGLVARI